MHLLFSLLGLARGNPITAGVLAISIAVPTYTYFKGRSHATQSIEKKQVKVHKKRVQAANRARTRVKLDKRVRGKYCRDC